MSQVTHVSHRPQHKPIRRVPQNVPHPPPRNVYIKNVKGVSCVRNHITRYICYSFYAQHAYRIVFLPMFFKIKNRIQIKTKCIQVISLPKSHFISTGGVVICSAVSLILCTGKWIKQFTKTALVFNLHLQYIRLEFQEN
jgi:hypothetical protein